MKNSRNFVSSSVAKTRWKPISLEPEEIRGQTHHRREDDEHQQHDARAARESRFGLPGPPGPGTRRRFGDDSMTGLPDGMDPLCLRGAGASLVNLRPVLAGGQSTLGARRSGRLLCRMLTPLGPPAVCGSLRSAGAWLALALTDECVGPSAEGPARARRHHPARRRF